MKLYINGDIEGLGRNVLEEWVNSRVLKTATTLKKDLKEFKKTPRN